MRTEMKNKIMVGLLLIATGVIVILYSPIGSPDLYKDANVNYKRVQICIDKKQRVGRQKFSSNLNPTSENRLQYASNALPDHFQDAKAATTSDQVQGVCGTEKDHNHLESTGGVDYCSAMNGMTDVFHASKFKEAINHHVVNISSQGSSSKSFERKKNSKPDIAFQDDDVSVSRMNAGLTPPPGEEVEDVPSGDGVWLLVLMAIGYGFVKHFLSHKNIH